MEKIRDYSLTVTYEDFGRDEEQNIHKICHAVVKEVPTGKFEDTQEIIRNLACTG